MILDPIISLQDLQQCALPARPPDMYSYSDIKKKFLHPRLFAFKTLTIFLSLKLGILIVCYLYGGIS